jgi:hypothetical protein
MSTDLTGTVALITGATSGIGKAIAFALAGRGAHVLVGGRNAARGEAVVTSLRASGAKADFIDVDLGSSDSARELARRATELAGGHVDILVNNAAIFPMGPTPSMAEDDIDAVNPDPPGPRGQRCWARRSTSPQRWLQPGGRLYRTRSPQRSPIWLPTTPASFTARSWL